MAAPLLIQQVTGSLVASAGNMTAALATTAGGNSLIVGISIAPATTNVTTSLGDGTNVLKIIGAGTRMNVATGLGFVVMYYLDNIQGLVTPTMTWVHTGTQSAVMVVAEYSGLQAGGSLDQFIYGTGTGATATAGPTASTTYRDELIVAFGGTDFGNNAYTVGAGYGHLKQVGNANADGAMEDKQVTALGTQTATETFTSTDWGIGIASFLPDRANPLPNSGIRPHPFSPGLAR